MCIFSGFVEDVSKTKLCCAPYEVEGGGKRCMIFYQNNVIIGEDGGVAMILPVPNGESIQLHPVASKFPNFFRNLQTILTSEDSEYGRSLGDDVEMLKVERIGTYDVSVSHSFEELIRLNFEAFRLDESVLDVIRGKYPSSFGYVVCRMVQTVISPHPIVYSHRVDDDGEMFVPTFHHHMHKSGDGARHVVDWEHTIYVFGADRRRLMPQFSRENRREYFAKGILTTGLFLNGEGILDGPNTRLRLHWLFKSFVDTTELWSCVYRINIGRGYRENHDLIFYTEPRSVDSASASAPPGVSIPSSLGGDEVRDDETVLLGERRNLKRGCCVIL